MPALCPTRRLPRSMDWAEAAVCTVEQIKGRHFDESTPVAVAACERCPVVAECLEHLLSWDEQVGWGAGMSAEQRKKMARRIERERGKKFMRVDRVGRNPVPLVG